ncbi:MAG TPA: aminotransferase class I/II-fold pyridoxal phosphate-dependent enzyme [Candidatus Sumerlaeota bacterium]|nr:MAG: Cystathionine gamma-lyase [candidate division BRC1 bacterium ADurb.Bin183]HOE63613.1 aminotransferase class I/II-fold pyridoxal phosphate-dependent enzyme [Candidatus Sumerlaeota bacterium]HRR32276.1 aminotransferase class I/II-fold pyridoxal phosphate-dependent enzyme [Candidatus Sumerlaeia bacterium]HON50509.1 aminotransferase class I/II-fold pyridoxal phosphate-dependent enzyme [Candidatus Sumerlaeota bacterium]HOR63724.1 aminotransferase class I/II-fold pyridoxal phosphate-dependent
MDFDPLNFSDISVYAGEEYVNAYNSITTPIIQTSTFVFRNSQDIDNYTHGINMRYEYGRYGNPTQTAAEKKLAALEGAEEAVLFSSGMSAITTTLLALLRSGDHIVITDDAYKKTLEFCKTALPQYGVESTVVSVHDYEAMEAAIRPNTRIFFSESPTNPYLNVMDLERLSKMVAGKNIYLISDSTFATPYNQRPLELGVNIVIHSCTKYLAGHNDLLAGVVLGPSALIGPIRDFHKMMGGVIGPFTSYMLIRGLKTFALRMQRFNENGQKIAEYLEKHPRIQNVYYPGLPSHRYCELAKRTMRGFGAVVTFEVDADYDGTRLFLDRLQRLRIGPSFGGVESLITHPASVSYYNYAREERLALGIKDNLVRFAAGIEEAEAIIEDLEQALSVLK